jgi:hypothetical protein
MSDLRLVSADSHVNEPPEIFADMRLPDVAVVRFATVVIVGLVFPPR